MFRIPRRDVTAARRRFASLALAALVAGLPHAARAEITPEASEVVDRYIEVTGGRAALDSFHSIRIKATVKAFGLSGTTEGLARRPNLRASATAIGPLQIADGFDGEKAWRTGPDGKVAALDGLDLEDARASGYFENDLWLLPDQGGGKVRMHSYERDSAATYTLIEVSPPVGKPRQLWFNQKTGLIDRTTMRSDQRVVTIRQWDYRKTDGGRLIAFQSLTQVAGAPANDISVTIDSVWVNETLADERFAQPGAAGPSVTYLKTPGVARIPFEYRQRHVWFKASVNGAPPADFLYDTGASITVIDSAYAAKLGLKTEGRMDATGAGAGGGASFSQVDVIRIETADGDGIELRDRKVAVLSVNPFLAPFFWRECAGIIGYDAITQFVNEIDFDAAVLTLRDPKDYQYQGGGSSIPFRLAGTVPVIPIKIDGTYEGEVRLDVGSSSTVDLHSPFVARHDLIAKAGKTIEVTGGGFGGTFKSRMARMKKMEVGSFTWDAPLVVLSGATTGALASEDYAGNAGNHLLERFKCTFDYERRMLHLEPSKRFAQPDRFSLAGVQLVREDGAVKAMEVIPGSAAEKAGIQEGDVVTAIDGRAASELTPEDLRMTFEEGEVGRKVKVELTRDGKAKKATLKLATIL